MIIHILLIYLKLPTVSYIIVYLTLFIYLIHCIVKSINSFLIVMKHVNHILQIGMYALAINGSTDITSDSLINGTDLLFKCISNVSTIMLQLDYAPKRFIMATIVAIPKCMKSNITCSENNRPITIGSLLGKVFDKIIISHQHDFLFSSSYQFGFKPHSSTVLCSTLFIAPI